MPINILQTYPLSLYLSFFLRPPLYPLPMSSHLPLFTLSASSLFSFFILAELLYFLQITLPLSTILLSIYFSTPPPPLWLGAFARFWWVHNVGRCGSHFCGGFLPLNWRGDSLPPPPNGRGDRPPPPPNGAKHKRIDWGTVDIFLLLFFRTGSRHFFHPSSVLFVATDWLGANVKTPSFFLTLKKNHITAFRLENKFIDFCLVGEQ
jgi:hypothetical protein